MLRLIDEPRWRCATIPVRLLSSRNGRLMAATVIASVLRVSRARGAGHAKKMQLGPQHECVLQRYHGIQHLPNLKSASHSVGPDHKIKRKKKGSFQIRSAQDIGRRLRHTREVLGLNQREFAMRANLKENRYNQYETGVRPLTIEAALSICEQYGVTLDWLYRGDRSTLPHRLAIDIARIEAAKL